MASKVRNFAKRKLIREIVANIIAAIYPKVFHAHIQYVFCLNVNFMDYRIIELGASNGI